MVSYKYRLDNDDWSQEQPVSHKITFDIFDEGTHGLAVIGKAGSGIWQAEQNPTWISWVVDTTPPEAMFHNYPTGIGGPFTADILVSNDDVAAYRYSLDGDTWSTTYAVSIPIALPALQDGLHSLAVMGADIVGNWQDAENATEIAWKVDATVPTALLTNLPAIVTNQTSIAIAVGAPNDAIPIENYTYTIDSNFNWWSGDVSNPIEISRLNQGRHSICVNAYGNGTWQDGSDDGISSTISATCYEWRIDLTAPDPVILKVESAESYYVDAPLLTASKSARLTWSWTSDDALEVLSHYRVWYSTMPITWDSHEQAVEVFCDIIPGNDGFEENFIVNGLAPGGTYYFAVTAVDLAGNESDLSTSPTLKMKNNIPEIHSLAFVQEGLTTDNAATEELLISGAYFLGSGGRNIIRFASNETKFEVHSKQGTDETSPVDIPIGAPTGTYRVQVINKNGVSINSADRVTIVDSKKPLPTVRSVIPLVISTGAPVSVTITGDNFAKALTGVNLLYTGGGSYALMDFTRINENTITALVDLAEDFPEGSYCLQVVNAEGEYNEISAAKLEVWQPIRLNAASGATTTSGVIRLEDGLVPAYIFLTSDDHSIDGVYNQNHARVKVFLEPGTQFEVQDQNGWIPYDGAILPPRVQPSASYMSGGNGNDIVSFGMGAIQGLRLGEGARMFVSLEISLPAYITSPRVYQVEPDGSFQPAGSNGNWRGYDILVGGTILAERFNTPETGVTTFTIGVLMNHMSEYVIGSLSNEAETLADFSNSTDNYGPCFIGAIVSIPVVKRLFRYEIPIYEK